MINENWEIQIVDRTATFLTDIFIFRRGIDNKNIFYRTDDKGQGEEVVCEYGTQPPPALTITTFLVPILLDKLIKKGIKPPEQSFIQGKLEATQDHLKDLKKLLKL